jgi:hypothetical protein
LCHHINPSLSAGCCIFAALSSAARSTNLFDFPSIQCGGWLLCCSVSDQPPAVNQLELNMLMCRPLLLFLINHSGAAPSTLRVHKHVDCYVCELLLQQQQLHPSRCTSLVHKSTENTDLCTAIRPFSVVLMAEMAAAGQSPAAADIADGVGWL